MSTMPAETPEAAQAPVHTKAPAAAEAPAGAAEAAPGDTNYEPTTSDMYLHMEMLEQKREEARERKREEARERMREEARERMREEAREQMAVIGVDWQSGADVAQAWEDMMQ